jgi:putative Holliday junction resolvase
MRILCLDVGTKRIGVALSDELNLTAQSLCTIERTGLKRDIAVIKEIVEKYNVEKIVVGMPFNLSGETGKTALAVKNFVEKLTNSTGVNVVEWDERFSTIAVNRVLHDAKLSRTKRKGIVDELSAVYILQGYLDSGTQ